MPLFFPPRWRRLLACALLLLPACALRAAEEVEVALVRFAAARAPGGGSQPWLEAEVVIQARPAPGAPGQMVSRVRVALLLGFEVPGPAGADRRLDHYRADAECVALEPGRTSVRFYLPPELVKRDGLRGEPRYWGVELGVGGKPVPAGRSAYATSLATPEQRRAFQQRGGTAAAAQDGLLQPQYLTPFASDYTRAAPSFVRREAP